MVKVSHKKQAVKKSQFLVFIINYDVKCPVMFCCILVNIVRKYKRRTERGKFTAADLQDAAGEVNEDKRSIHSVAKEAGICHVTLNRYIKKHRDGIPFMHHRYQATTRNSNKYLVKHKRVNSNRTSKRQKIYTLDYPQRMFESYHFSVRKSSI